MLGFKGAKGTKGAKDKKVNSGTGCSQEIIHLGQPKKAFPEGVQGSKPLKFAIFRSVFGLLEACRGHKKAILGFIWT